MNYNFLKRLNETDLTELEDIILGKMSTEELLKEIEVAKNKSLHFEHNNYDFVSGHIPNYDKELEEKCTEILKQIQINDVFFLLVSFLNKGNTKYSNIYEVPIFYKNLEDKNALENLNILLRMAYRTYYYYRTNHEIQSTLDLWIVDELFKNNLFQKDFEGPYNMLNYIKNYIYQLLKQKKEITPEDIYEDYYEKRELVTIQIKDISSYLCKIRNGTNLRLCISNAGLSKNTNKTGNKITFDQSLYIDALSFGTTLEKLENKDYEDYKKLLYLPKGKTLTK